MNEPAPESAPDLTERMENGMTIDDIKFPWEYTDDEIAKMSEIVGEHGRCVDYRQEAYCDIHVFEDGYEERLYIGD